MKQLKQSMKLAKETGASSIKLNSGKDQLLQEAYKIIKANATPLTAEGIRALGNETGCNLVVCIAHPEWGVKGVGIDCNGYVIVGKGCNSKVVFDEEAHHWADAKNLPFGIDAYCL